MVGLLLLLAFLALAYLMFSGRLAAMVALPLLALIVTIIAGLPYYYHEALQPNLLEAQEFQRQLTFLGRLKYAFGSTLHLAVSVVIKDGVTKLAAAIMTVMLGGLFGQLLKRSGVADTLVRRVAELAGDNTFAVSYVLSLAVAFLFTTLGGLGSVIMVANITFPVLLSLGMPPVVVGCQFLVAMCFGGVFNLVNWQLYLKVLEMDVATVASFAVPFGFCYLIIMTVFTYVECKRAKLPVSPRALQVVIALGVLIACALYLFRSNPTYAKGILDPIKDGFVFALLLSFFLPIKGSEKSPSIMALVSPAVPILLVVLCGIDINAAFVVGILFLLRFSGAKNYSRLLIQSAIEGIQAVAPAIAVMMGIGMVVVAVWQKPVSESLTPIIKFVLPTSKVGFVLFFGCLAPMALYRGPLNIWGMGSGLLKLVQATGLIATKQIMAAFMSTGQIQGVCDPTNTHNVWVANQLKVETSDILKRTLPYMWTLAFMGLLLGVYVK
jgi:hypothetical protein